MNLKPFLPLLAGSLLLLATACSSDRSHKPSATGRAFEVLVVSPRAIWDGALGDTLRAILLEPVPMLNQREPHMDPVPLLPAGFTNIIEKHRNVIMVEIDTASQGPALQAAYDVFAAPQLIVRVTGPDEKTLTDYLWAHREELLQVFAMAERDRYVAYATRQAEQAIREKVREKFGFELSVPKGYTIRNELPDFLWISFELPLVSQGVAIYRYPYTGTADFTADSLVARRNRFTALIPGPSDSSYMTTADVPPAVEYKRINGRLWAVMHGFWDVHGDYMGGPFVSYSTLDIPTGQVICLDGYVFSPRHHKRNYIRELENLIYTVSFPGEPQGAAEE